MHPGMVIMHPRMVTIASRDGDLEMTIDASRDGDRCIPGWRSIHPGMAIDASRCHGKMGTPQNGDLGSPYSREYGNPGPHFPGKMGTPGPHFPRSMGTPSVKMGTPSMTDG